jgi:hypothetical protein
MSTAPRVPAGVTQVMDVADTRVGEVQVAPPTVTVAPESKFAPVIVMVVPPAFDPDAGDAEVTVGGSVTKGNFTMTTPDPPVPAEMGTPSFGDPPEAPPPVFAVPLPGPPPYAEPAPPPAPPACGDQAPEAGTEPAPPPP